MNNRKYCQFALIPYILSPKVVIFCMKLYKNIISGRLSRAGNMKNETGSENRFKNSSLNIINKNTYLFQCILIKILILFLSFKFITMNTSRHKFTSIWTKIRAKIRTKSVQYLLLCIPSIFLALAAIENTVSSAFRLSFLIDFFQGDLNPTVLPLPFQAEYGKNGAKEL